jgi:signal transduction histidine kinase
LAGIPIQLVRALLAVLISASLWVYHEQCSHPTREVRLPGGTHRGFQIAFTLAVVLTVGWIATELVGRHGDHDMRESMQNDATLAAAALNPANIPLTGAAAGPAIPDKDELQRQLTQMGNSHTQIRGLYLTRLTEDGKGIGTIACSVPGKTYCPVGPGGAPYNSTPAGLLDTFAGMIVPPEVHSDTRGLLITAFAPVRDPSNGRIIAALTLDMDANQWQKDVAEFRLGPIVATFLVSVLLIGSFVTREKALEAAEQLAEARDLLEEKVEARTRQLQAAQSHLVMQEKMATVGQLAAGIAHEISNPISYVAINFRTLQEDIEVFKNMVAAYRDTIAGLAGSTDPRAALAALREREESSGLNVVLEHVDRLFSESRDGFRRVMEIVTSMRDFSRMDDPSKFKLFNINKSVHDALIVGQNSYKYHAETETKLGDIPDIECVPDLINRVLLNLVVNAAQAITDQERREKKGRITISTWSDADNVYCEVADNGPGIPPEIQTRIFEPFFTTKDIGKGTGLGLSLSYDTIVVKHGGDLTVNSVPGQGTQFLIRLPIRRPTLAGTSADGKPASPNVKMPQQG